MQQYLRWALLIGGLFFVVQPGKSQMTLMRGWELGGWVGASNYFGDLNTNWRLNRSKFALGAVARFNFNDRLGFKAGASYGRIEAFDTDSKNIYEQRRNLDFRSVIIDLSTQLEFNFMPYIHGHRDFYYTPYMFIGPSAYYFNPRTQLDGQWYSLPEMGTEGQFRGEEYNTLQGAIAYGMGFKYDLNYRYSLNVELSMRKVFTDYLDDVSGNYADPRDIEALRGPTAAALADKSTEPKIGLEGRQRGNGKRNDSFGFIGIGFMYYFGQIRCPQMVR